jgi:DNA-binding SARP family transcriptional activator
MLRLITFGGVGIRETVGDPGRPGEPAVSRRALALLVAVAAAHRTGVSRDKALALLWPESDEDHGRNALRQSLHTLRRELGPSALLSGDSLRLNPEVITSDLKEFDEARAAGRLEEAAAAYGGPFLDGFHVPGVPDFERWVDENRASYAREAAVVLENLARRAGQANEHAAAVQWWQRRCALDPFNSAAAAGLMEAMAAAGDRAGAIRHGKLHADLLRDELGADPEPVITRLVERLRAGGAPAPAAPKPAVREVSIPPVPPRADFLEQLRTELAGRYTIEAEIERGRDGAVRLLRARDLRHDRVVVLKVVHPALASVLDVDRFLREIKLTARLQHPHILPLLDSGEVAGRPWYAMPETTGESLRRRLTREGRIPLDVGIRLIQGVAGALDHAHRHEVVHRDVSPENILLAEGHALLTNLGVARALDAAGGPRLTETGMLVGTPAYMSPEQAAGVVPLDGRSDQYSLGCVLFEMLIGEPLFTGPTPQAIMAKRAAFMSRVRERLHPLPPGVAEPLGRALAPAPADRYPAAGEFAAALTGGEGAPARQRWLAWLRMGKR